MRKSKIAALVAVGAVGYLLAMLGTGAIHARRYCRADLTEFQDAGIRKTQTMVVALGWPISLPFVLLDAVIERSAPILDQCASESRETRDG